MSEMTTSSSISVQPPAPRRLRRLRRDAQALGQACHAGSPYTWSTDTVQHLTSPGTCVPSSAVPSLFDRRRTRSARPRSWHPACPDTTACPTRCRRSSDRSGCAGGTSACGRSHRSPPTRLRPASRDRADSLRCRPHVEVAISPWSTASLYRRSPSASRAASRRSSISRCR